MAVKLSALFMLVVGMTTADAAPNIPSSELPGRERQRFLESPVDRFTDPLARPRNNERLWQRDCDENARPKSRAKQKRGC